MTTPETQPRKPVLLPQVNPSATRCAQCHGLIPSGQRYLRMTYEPDGRDPDGADFHPACVGKLQQ